MYYVSIFIQKVYVLKQCKRVPSIMEIRNKIAKH